MLIFRNVTVLFYSSHVFYLLNRFIECENYFSFFKQILLQNYFNFLTHSFYINFLNFLHFKKNIRCSIKYCFFIQKNNFLFQRTIVIPLYKTYYYSLSVLCLVLCLSFFDVSFLKTSCQFQHCGIVF